MTDAFLNKFINNFNDINDNDKKFNKNTNNRIAHDNRQH